MAGSASGASVAHVEPTTDDHSFKPESPDPPACQTEAERAKFGEALERHRPELLRYLRTKLPSEADAADLAQDTYTRILYYRDRVAEIDVRAMLFRIANNLVVNFYRHRRRHHLGEHVPLDDAGPLASEELPQIERLANEQALQALRQAIAGLPPRCRMAFMLKRFRGMTYAAIARQLEISETMVEKHVARAVLACKRAVGENRG